MQAADVNRDLSIATGAGTSVVIAAGAGAASAKVIAPKLLQKSSVLTRWSAMRLGKFLGKPLTSSSVSTGFLKLIQMGGVAKSVENAQAAWGSSYLDLNNRPMVIYTDFRESGQSIYSHDVSPAWVKQAHHWLYEVVFWPLKKIFSIK